MNSWYTIPARGTGAEVVIYDEIGAYGVSAKGFLAELGALPVGTPIDLRLNSPGGSVFDAVAIYNAIKRHEGSVTVWIDGIAASAASYVAMAGDEIVMPENAFLMIHDPAGLVMGTADDMRAMADALDKVKNSLVQGYAAKSGRTPEDIAVLMGAETWFDAKDALDAGLATRIAEPVGIAARFDIARFRNAPPALIEAAEPDTPETVPDGNGSEDDAAANPAEQDYIADAAGADDQPGSAAGHVKHANMPPPESGAPPDAAAIRADAIAHARAVIDLCRLAQQPQMAGRFLEQDTPLDEIRAALLDAKADAEPEIIPHHPQPGRHPAARPWGEIVARTFKLKG
jgi:ATP-dependent protease ClpP protease subunit